MEKLALRITRSGMAPFYLGESPRSNVAFLTSSIYNALLTEDINELFKRFSELELLADCSFSVLAVKEKQTITIVEDHREADGFIIEVSVSAVNYYWTGVGQPLGVLEGDKGLLPTVYKDFSSLNQALRISARQGYDRPNIFAVQVKTELVVKEAKL